MMPAIVSGFSETNFNRWFKTPLNPRVGLGGVLLRGLTRGCQPLGMGGVILTDQKGEVLVWAYIKLNITDCLRLEI